ncbi:MAG: hypothetical protein M4D80_10515 [Myxococcota bacterium]|nr:hypothetical protein [Deltaproteobacteria bacterium]MDQ3335588.1 hypothetical protein [Myxococcota bacterium]
MKITQMLVIGLAVAACQKGGPTQETFPERQLGESTASPGANASKPQPITPDDPRVMNVSASISPQQQQQATPVPVPARSDATSSTPVQPPTDIAPRSTTTETNRPGVFSPPPVSPATQPTSTSPPPPATAPTPAPQ